jgi:PhoH-like ATPase
MNFFGFFKQKRNLNQKKLLVLDTNVLMHDPTVFMKCQEHDIFIPAIVLEELDNAKKYTDVAGFNARQSSRFIDELFRQLDFDADIDAGVPLSLLSAIVVSSSERSIAPTGMLYFQSKEIKNSAGVFKKDSHDNEILSVALDLKKQKKNVVVVSNDINVRSKARILRIRSELYKNDQTIEDIQLLYSGTEELPPDFVKVLFVGKSSSKDGLIHYEITTPLAKKWKPCQFLYIEGDEEKEFMVLKTEEEKATIRTIHNYRKQSIWGIVALNREQNFALNAILDPEIDFVSLAGRSGSGKTINALAGAISQVLETRRYTQIIFTRETAPIGRDIGLLPGTEEQKMAPWLGALYDNLEVLDEKIAKTKGDPSVDKILKDGKIANPLVSNRIAIKSLNFIRGRTLLRKFLILDEAQDTTAKQVKDIITRAGPGTKVVFLGNLAQVASPYITPTSSGLAYVVDRFKNCEFGAHVTLIGVERSRLAEYATDYL